MCKAITSVASGKILLAKTNWFFHEKSSTLHPNFTLAAGGEPSTRFPPEGLVETAADLKLCEKPRSTIIAWIDVENREAVRNPQAHTR